MTGPDYDRLLNDLKAHITQEIKTLKNIVIEKPINYDEAAKYLGIAKSTLYQRLRTGHYPPSIAHNDGGSVHFFASELQQFIKSH
jgi:excisionase family DNA binding protein